MSGKVRTGARSWNDLIKKACQLSHTPGFRPGLEVILGEVGVADVLPLWDAFCVAFEVLISNDDWFNKMDATSPSPTGGEDSIPL